ncbi:glycerol-3-phosphate dehydrogenase [Nocardioides psychrotolerans]|uniref:Glycerol-3-phosphate dehydrogenase n=1 Tax=Nocardioides psychrotolerans TaxID=1005945 RepID=A0A1I3HKX3_9ACTN|nr:glycerol-3-phosphate dehydrogenase/oxidase [Nocardioides psychrotolerans]GEP40012.1 glycerol-3-phosphate dehydrogenase [Nocardioides psychrotolerans]SFI36283.1 glycerol-3-phosphate dehydrogenase [Nocardioides psychrotolerans]
MEDDSIPYDVIVVGAGINGLGVARDAALRGLRVVLLEQDDVCSGVSAWSGRLVHGGLRYLEHRDFALVRESLRERELLFRLAPHLVKPRRLLMPFYSHNRRPARLIRLGMFVYDALSFDKRTDRHEILDTRATLRRFSGIGRDGLGGAAVFTDGQVEYAERLCVEVALAAAGVGAVIKTKSRVEEPVLEAGRVVGVRYVDTTTGESHEVRGHVVLNVAGPWIDRIFQRGAPPQPRLNGGTKGSHLVVDPFPGAPDDVVYYESKTDGRLVLVIPWMGRYLIGTTDLRFDDDPDLARCDVDEMTYLLSEVNTLVPGAGLTPAEVLFTYSGVRPLPYAPGVEESKVPRSHVLHDHAPDLPGLVSVVGGKLTTYRQLAEDAVDDVFKRLGRKSPKCVTASLPLPGAVGDLDESRRFLLARGLAPRTVERLVALYGGRCVDVLAEAEGDERLIAVLHEPTGAIAAELVFAVRHELARSLTDVLARRVLLAFEPGHGLDVVDAAAELLGELLGWSGGDRAAEIAEYQQWLTRLAVPKGVAVVVER